MTIHDLQSNTVISTCPHNTVVALGCFDGVHMGHRALLAKAAEKAPGFGAFAAVWTFSEHPFKRGEVLTVFSDKLVLFAACGIRYVFSVSYEEVKDLSTLDFVQNVLIKECHAIATVCGFNFHFGKGAAGDHHTLLEHMKANGYESFTVDAVTYADQPISSTRIRARLLRGETEDAAAMLGHYYSLSLPVLHGKELGRTLDAPTVNQEIPEKVQSLRFGTYATITEIDGILYPSVTNIGTRPSISQGDDHHINAETHIIGYIGWLYDTTVRVYYCHRLRDEMHFSSLDDLKAQIKRDCVASQRTFDYDKAYCMQKGDR